MLPSQKCRVGGVGEGWEGVGATAPFSDQLTVLSEPQFFVFIQRQVAHPCLHRRQDMQHPPQSTFGQTHTQGSLKGLFLP